MTSKRFLQVIPAIAIAIFMMATSAEAGPITYSTNVTGTGFVAPISGLTLTSASGVSATLTFQPDVDIETGVPSNINLGIFTLVCTACSSNSQVFTVFNAFTFDLVVTDETDGATGEFVGTSTGGDVEGNSSTITISWSPLEIGPGTSDALTGSFGLTYFEIPTSTEIVAPNSGSNVGQATVEGDIDSGPAISSVPEPGLTSLIGAGLIGLGMLLRGRSTRK
jgi:hypothetical protein